jgi:hypothetical protein
MLGLPGAGVASADDGAATDSPERVRQAVRRAAARRRPVRARGPPGRWRSFTPRT